MCIILFLYNWWRLLKEVDVRWVIPKGGFELNIRFKALGKG